MIKGGDIPIMKVPMRDFGFLSMSEFAGQDLKEAFSEALEQYSPEAQKSIFYDFSFNSEGKAMGSSPFVSVFLNQKNLLPEGEHLLSLSQFGSAFNRNANFFKNTYQDTGVILRTNGDNIERNDYVAKNLFGKLSKRGIIASPENPVVISITDLRLRQDKNSKYDIVWDIKEDAEPIIAPEFGIRESVKKFDLYDEQGIPIPKQKGKFTIWKRETGLSSVYSGSGGDAVSDTDHFVDSGEGGRVTVGGEVVPQSYTQIEKMISQEETRRDLVKRDLEARIAKL